PDFPPALLAQARLCRLAGRLEEAETLLRSFVDKPIPERLTLALAWYELGTIHDSQRRYDDAMAAFLQAKAVSQPAAAQNLAYLERIRKARKETTRTVSADLFQS